MESKSINQEANAPGPSQPTEPNRNLELLMMGIEQEWQQLLTGIRIYVSRFGLAADASTVDTVARDILQDTVVTALGQSGNYDPQRLALPWLLGVAINHIRHRRRALGIESRVVPVADLRLSSSREGDSRSLSTDEIFDLLTQRANARYRPNQLTVNEILSLVNEDDRQILQLAFMEGLRGKDLAAKLGISEGAAWTRTSRALGRLREAYFETAQEKGKKN